MKKKPIKKLRLDKIKVAKLSATQQPGKCSFVSGAITVCGESICVCSWPTEDC